MSTPDPIAALFSGVRQTLRDLDADGWIGGLNLVERAVTEALKEPKPNGEKSATDRTRREPPGRTEYGVRNKASESVYGPMTQVEAVDMADVGGTDWEVVQRTITPWLPLS